VVPAPAPEAVAAAGAGAARYSGFVQPDHPLVAAIFPAPEERGEDAVADALAAVKRHCAYRSRPGRRSFDELLEARRSSDTKLEINCVDLVCLVVSHLRAAGFGEEEAYVALAGKRGFLQHHAWALVPREGGHFLWIDPAELVPAARTGADILARHDVYAVFNDRRLFFTAGEKRRLLLGEAP
jgi:hypothetical protein